MISQWKMFNSTKTISEHQLNNDATELLTKIARKLLNKIQVALKCLSTFDRSSQDQETFTLK